MKEKEYIGYLKEARAIWEEAERVDMQELKLLFDRFNRLVVTVKQASKSDEEINTILENVDSLPWDSNTHEEWYENQKEGIANKFCYLYSVLKEHIEKKEQDTGVRREINKRTKRIFIGHGQREIVRRRLTDFIQRRLNLEPIVLMDEATGGMTVVVEHLEKYGSLCDYALIILTGEDVTLEGGKRARQNVVFELGYFCGKLGRRKVLLLAERGVELFSNISGIIRKEFSDDNISEIFDEIRKEMESEGII